MAAVSMRIRVNPARSKASFQGLFFGLWRSGEDGIILLLFSWPGALVMSWLKEKKNKMVVYFIFINHDYV